MPFYFAAQEAWVKPPVPAFWLKPSIAKKEQKMAKLAIPAPVAFLSITALR